MQVDTFARNKNKTRFVEETMLSPVMLNDDNPRGRGPIILRNTNNKQLYSTAKLYIVH